MKTAKKMQLITRRIPFPMFCNQGFGGGFPSSSIRKEEGESAAGKVMLLLLLLVTTCRSVTEDGDTEKDDGGANVVWKDGCSASPPRFSLSQSGISAMSMEKDWMWVLS